MVKIKNRISHKLLKVKKFEMPKDNTNKFS